MKYSIFSLARNALSGHKNWQPAWRSPDPKPEYDVIIVGGGGHGLATAYYLAKVHGITNVAVLEKGWLGGGNVGRNTTIIRSNYLLPGNNPFYEKSLQSLGGPGAGLQLQCHGLAARRDQPVPFRRPARCLCAARQRHAHSRRAMPRSSTSTACATWCRSWISTMRRFPIMGGLHQRRGGTVRHDAVAWGFARGADMRGVDIIQNCEVTGIRHRKRPRAPAWTPQGLHRRKKSACALPASSSRVMAQMAGLRLPIESHVLQAFVSEGLKPSSPCA